MTEDLRREIESLRDQRAAVHDVLRQVARSEGLQPVLEEIVSAAVRLCRGEDAEVFLAQGDLLYLRAHSESANPSKAAFTVTVKRR